MTELMDPMEAEEFRVEAVTSASGECVLSLHGSLDWHTRPRLDSALEPLLDASGPARLVLDLADVAYTDSAGLAAMVRARRILGERGGGLVLRDCQPAVLHALDVTRLAKLFELTTGSSTR